MEIFITDKVKVDFLNLEATPPNITQMVHEVSLNKSKHFKYQEEEKMFFSHNLVIILWRTSNKNT